MVTYALSSVTYELQSIYCSMPCNDIFACKVRTDWGSPVITWERQPVVDNSQKIYADSAGNKYIFDMTDWVKEWIDYLRYGGSVKSAQRYGFCILSEGDCINSYCACLSADNVVYCPRLVIHFND